MAGAVAGGLFNAFAFAGAGYVFKLLDKGGAAELKRHNEAMERLTRERDEWNEARLKEIDRVTALHHEQQVGEKDRQETLGDFRDYAEVRDHYESTRQHQQEFQERRRADLQRRIDEVNREYEKKKPQLDYHPSKKMQEYVKFVKYLTAGVVSAGVVFLVL